MSGFRILGDAATPLGTGVVDPQFDVTLSDLEIAGARQRARSSTSAVPGGPIVAEYFTTTLASAIAVRTARRRESRTTRFSRTRRREHAAGTLLVESGRAPGDHGEHVLRAATRVARRRRDGRLRRIRRATTGSFAPPGRRPPAAARRGAGDDDRFSRHRPYRIVREIGHGGMATVFLAEDTRARAEVALKLVLDRPRTAKAREILDAERWGAKLQARLAEACGLVPRVYEDGDQPPYYFIAMEYVAGREPVGRDRARPVGAGRGRTDRRGAEPVPRRRARIQDRRSTGASSGRWCTAT